MSQPAIVLYLPPGTNVAPHSYGWMVLHLFRYWVEASPDRQYIVANSSGSLPPQLTGVSAAKVDTVLPGIAGRIMLRRKLERVCRQFGAICWMPMGPEPGALRSIGQVVGLPFSNASMHPRQLAGLLRQPWRHETVFTCHDAEQAAYWQQQGLKATPIGQCLDTEPLELSWAMGEAIKMRFADGLEYFLYAGPLEPLEDMVYILKAFSRFKKRHHTGMRLVLLGNAPAPADLLHKLATYAFRHDVQVPELLPATERRQLIAAAYGLLRGPQQDAFARPLLEAISSGVPALVHRHTADAGLADGDIWLYDSQDQLFDGMCRLFADEHMRRHLKDRMLNNAANHSRAAMLQRLLGCLPPGV